MKSIYPKLAIEGIKKNKRLYFPYIITGSMMVMMYYILSFLSEAPAVKAMKGGEILTAVLPMGCGIIAVFSLLFLFYTNSFLIKQRYREFGLYNVLGMDRKNICKIMLWESFFTFIFVIISGLIAGVALSKASELILLNLLYVQISYDFTIGLTSLLKTPIVFLVIYLILLINSLIRVIKAKPLELMNSSKAGERVPKKAWALAPLGVLFLAFAYYLAVTIDEPVNALFWFFVAVISVIIGTYLLLISGSVVFCKLLSKNKRYYYKPNHFVSVSSMVYRMKKNGAGLASICILLTMVLVMISSASCLYFGAEDSIAAKCPNSINITLIFDDAKGISDENINAYKEVIGEYGKGADVKGMKICEISSVFTKEGAILDFERSDYLGLDYYKVGYLQAVSLEDYNSNMGKNESLSDDECLMYCSRIKYKADTFKIDTLGTYNVKKQLEDFKADGETLAMTVPVIYLVLPNQQDFIEKTENLKNDENEPKAVYYFRSGFDIDNPEDELSVASNLSKALGSLEDEKDINFYKRNIVSREDSRASFYDMYGSLLFLGIMLSIVFILAAVLIIYYKQISEGYEDCARFEIMQNIGMAKKDIKKSINSQVLTVFFLPLVLAGVHLAFSFPFVSKILLMFAFNNTLLSISINLLCFAIFGILYAIVYKITSGAYYNIVSKKD